MITEQVGFKNYCYIQRKLCTFMDPQYVDSCMYLCIQFGTITLKHDFYQVFLLTACALYCGSSCHHE